MRVRGIDLEAPVTGDSRLRVLYPTAGRLHRAEHRNASLARYSHIRRRGPRTADTQVSSRVKRVVAPGLCGPRVGQFSIPTDHHARYSSSVVHLGRRTERPT